MGKADLHIHTAFSDGMAEACQLLEYVEEQTELDVLAVTDHDDVRGALAAREIWAQGRFRFDFVTGVEVTAIEGHLLALFVEEPVPTLCPVRRVLEAVHRQDGLCVIPHPLSPFTRSLDRPTIERIASRGQDGAYFDAIEAVHRSPLSATWRRTGGALNRRLKLAAVANSDSHHLKTIGSATTEFSGSSSEELKRAIVSRTSRAVTNSCPTLAEIGYGQVVQQAWRGLTATPRIVGWGPTAQSFVKRIFHSQ
jgi:predicted metal-dependent phosphoesterase TrpH